MEKDEVAALESLEEGCCEKFIWFRFSLAALRFGQETVQGLGLGLAMVFAARATASKLLTPGDFVLIVSLITQLFEPLSVSRVLDYPQKDTFLSDTSLVLTDISVLLLQTWFQRRRVVKNDRRDLRLLFGKLLKPQRT